MRVHQPKMNPQKYVFGVSTGHFLDFLVHQKELKLIRIRHRLLLQQSLLKISNNYKDFSNRWIFLRDLFLIVQERFSLFHHYWSWKHRKSSFGLKYINKYLKIKIIFGTIPNISAAMRVPLKLYLLVVEDSIESLLSQDNEKRTKQQKCIISAKQ